MLKSMYRYLRNKFYLAKYINKNVRFLENVKIDAGCFFEGYNTIGANNILNNCHLGTGTYTSYNVRLTSVKIGRFCSIAANVHNITGKHPTNQFVSTHPSFFSLSKVAGFTFTKKQLFVENDYVSEKYLVVIGNDVWIGDNVSIMGNIKIGDGAIIGANSLVTKNIEPYSVNIGTPAKMIRNRFNQDSINVLLNFKWWNKELKWIENNSHLFADIEQFIKIIAK